MDEKEKIEKKEVGDVLFDLKRRYDNFWYHHKIAIICGVIFLAFTAVLVAQCASKTQGDASFAYIGMTIHIGENEYNELQYALTEILGDDLNGDGRVRVDFTHYKYMTQEQLERAWAGGQMIDLQTMQTVWAQVNLELSVGNVIIYFLDPEVYRQLSGPGVFMSLEEALGYTPSSAITNDIHTIRLGALPCWNYYTGLYHFPADTLIAVRDMQPSEENKKKMRDRYERNLTMFKKLVEFRG